jgi:small GTP-binding protein
MSQAFLRIDAPVLKVIVVGSSGIGKTCLIGAFVNHQFDPGTSPTVTPAYACQELMRTDGLPVCLQVWDTAGQDRYHNVSALFYREADVALICYEAGSHYSLETVPSWVKKVRNQVPDCELIFVGTKADLLSKGECATVLAEARGTLASFQPKAYVLTSAITGDGVEQLFREVAEQYKPRLMQRASEDARKRAQKCC